MVVKYGKYEHCELEKVDRKNPVILKSGGPIMELLSVKDGVAKCEWDDGIMSFPVASLYKLTDL